MKFTTTDIIFREIQHGDPDFTMTDGIKLVPRAGIEISKQCPSNYARMIAECVNNGWLKPVSYVKESEYVWEKLGD
jgi:hypothetical protein